ncbi:MAG TPA: sigma-70 family RNA polymerase sigma factor [Thermomicrobiales bacterium]|nr:sigma-70 family RNA polymerase sigma factor [Thermomicrobiales bacterium]
MDGRDELATQFETHRPRLRAVAYRLLGSATEADDAVQEAWLRLSGAGTIGVANLGGWLTTVVARVCLDLLRARKARREEPLGIGVPGPVAPRADGGDPEGNALLVDTVGLALLVVLDTLAPAERLAFVLHDLFAVPFEEIAPMVERSPVAARQLASRARRRVRGAVPAPGADLARQRRVVTAFLAAAREGDFAGLLAVLDPDVVLRADPAAVRAAEAGAAGGAPALARAVRGAAAVAETFAGRAGGARLALVDGAAGAAWAPGGQPRAVFAFAIAGGKIVVIDLIAEPARLGRLAVALLEG